MASWTEQAMLAGIIVGQEFELISQPEMPDQSGNGGRCAIAGNPLASGPRFIDNSNKRSFAKLDCLTELAIDLQFHESASCLDFQQLADDRRDWTLALRQPLCKAADRAALGAYPLDIEELHAKTLEEALQRSDRVV